MKLILLIPLFISQFASADLHLTTLDDWQIFLYGKGALMVAKSNEEPEKADPSRLLMFMSPNGNEGKKENCLLGKGYDFRCAVTT